MHSEIRVQFLFLVVQYAYASTPSNKTQCSITKADLLGFSGILNYLMYALLESFKHF